MNVSLPEKTFAPRPRADVLLPYPDSYFAMIEKTGTNEPKGWMLLWKFLRDKPVIDALVTSVYFFMHPLQFTDEVLREDWRHKAKPPWFLIETYLFSILLVSFTSWGHVAEIDPSFTDVQRKLLVVAVTISFSGAVFATGLVVHHILGWKALPFIRAFFLYCYLQGVILLSFFGAFTGFWITYIDSQNGRPSLLTGLTLGILGIVTFCYIIFPVVRAYRPRWFRLVLAAIIGLLLLGEINSGLRYLLIGIVEHLPGGWK